MNGYDVCREIRLDDRLKHIPVLFLTARVDQADRIEGFLAGADDYLTKPFSLEELNLRIKAILRRVHGDAMADNRSDEIVVGDVVLNCRTFHVTTEKGDSLLTNVQFDLLYYLMVHDGKVFSTQQLLQAVWNYPPKTGSPELVRAHVRNLREKIEVSPSEPRHLCTVQGHGYTFRG
jgi:two-component system alkaline phosphatase synthesis response regulator PhoP/two-component system response regulator RpaA